MVNNIFNPSAAHLVYCIIHFVPSLPLPGRTHCINGILKTSFSFRLNNNLLYNLLVSTCLNFSTSLFEHQKLFSRL